MVEKGCASCREFQEHYYWDHMDVSEIRFFKLMTGDFTKGISLPEKFTRKINGQIPKAFNLKTPRGETWNIGLDKSGDDLLLLSGWGEFVKAYELQENDIIIFACSGNSSFDVLIFEANGCEKMSTLFGNITYPTTMHKHFNDRAAQCQNSQRNLLGDSEDTTMTPLLGSPHNAASALKKSSEKSCKQAESPNSSRYPVKHESIGEEDSGDEFPNSYYYYSMVADRLTQKEKEEIQRLASIQLNNPAFVTVLTKIHCQRRNNTLTIPSRFAADHLKETTHEIVLRRPNRAHKWMVHYLSSRRCFQNLELFRFVRENKLREGDICVFELMKGAKRVAMTVHVVRKVDERFVLVG